MRSFLAILLLPALLLAGCAHPDGHEQVQAAQTDLGRAASATVAADQDNAEAQAHVSAARTDAQRIDDKAVILENAKW